VQPILRPVVAFSRQPSVADFLKRVLEDAGFAATAVWSDLEDLEAAVKAQPPAAILCEIGFPLIDEWRRLADVLDRPSLHGVPIVVAAAANPDACRKAGVPVALDIFTRPSEAVIRRTIFDAIGKTDRNPSSIDEPVDGAFVHHRHTAA
jgi:CheY-like chemotaxis protein